MRANPATIVMADEQQMFLDALTLGLDSGGDLKVVATTRDSNKAFFHIVEHTPEIVIMDVELSGRGAFNVAEEVAARLPATKIVFLSSYLSDVLIDQSLRLDISGFLLKSDSLGKLVLDLHQILQGEKCYSAGVFERMEYDPTAKLFHVKSQSFLSSLTSRQLWVLRHLVRGESVKEIAKAMALSERAVESLKFRIMQKLGIRDRVELTRYAIREGLTTP